MEDVRVSVLMPVYNTARYLEDSLGSISRQSLPGFELVVIDDGSTDGSGEILAQHAAREPRMRLVSRENRGLISTRNELLALARGELVAWMDSDDIALPERLAKQVAAFEADDALVCVGTFAQCVDSDGERLNVEVYPTGHEAIAREQWTGGGMRFPTTMMKRSVALAVGGFREPFVIGEDLDLLLRLGEVGSLVNLPEALYVYRQHLASVCATLGHRWEVYKTEILTLARERRQFGQDRLQAGRHISIAVPIVRTSSQHLARTYVHWSICAIENGNRALAMKYAMHAVRVRPSGRAGWVALVRTAFRRL